jgi:3-oxoacyl-[acyl-carrier-protein] synthase-1
MTVALADASRRWGPGRVAVIVASDGRPDDSDGYDDALVELARRHARGRGIAFAVTGGTSASGRALETSWRLLAAGRCDAVLCVAVGPLVEARARGWSALGELGSAESRPLGAARDGVRLGEAAAAALIERQSETETALLGVGRAEGNDRGPRAVAGALASSGGEASRVSWVNLGADGRRESDRHLAATVAEALGDRPWVTTPAGLRGHVGAAQDLVAMVETVACIERGRVGPTPGAFDPAFKLRRVEAPLDLETDVAICLGTGSTGDCTAVALGAREP